MTSLSYEGGPLSTKDTGTVYPLSPNQVAPLSIRKNEWKGMGHYVLVHKKSPQFTPYLEWREAK